jgi:SAM-dependent methyltransferase
VNEEEIQEFWNAHPCGEEQVGGMSQDLEKFFEHYDQFRYTQHRHLLTCLDAIDFKRKQVLEIGLGLGADSEQIIRRGAHWSGVDLTPESVDRVSRRFELRGLSYEDLKCGSVLSLPFESDRFDIVFSHGVLHHVPEVKRAQAEICRVLKPSGRLIAMVYAKYSLNYLVSIWGVRRIGLAALFCARARSNSPVVRQHLENAHKMGLRKYLRMDNFIHRNTDGPLNPYSKVYDLRTVRQDFPVFEVERSYKRFMHAPPLPVSRLPLGSVLGWHLWIHLKPRKDAV